MTTILNNETAGVEGAAKPLLALTSVSKRFGGVQALDNVSFAATTHSIHAILGENGAGKSTLIKIIGGVVPADSGQMLLDGQEVRFHAPRDAIHHGVVCVFQELSLLPDLSVADNICITGAPRRAGLLDHKAQRSRAEELLARIGCDDINPRLMVKDLPLSRRQLIEIAKALGRNPRILILDEGTSALTAADTERVFGILHELRRQGLCILYISHRMHEVEELADTCTVFRGGRYIATFAQGSKRHDEIVQMMIGREITQVFPPKPPRREQPAAVLAIEGLNWTDRLKDINLSVGKGEIVGLGGLDGQGQRELLLSLFGVLRDTRGMVKIDGRPVSIKGPAEARSAGMSLSMVPEDRKSEGLMLSMSVRENMTLASLDRISRGGLIDRARETSLVEGSKEQLHITAASLDAPVGSLSGGNQQKVVLAKWLMIQPRIILLMDPMRGIDVGTKQELYHLMRRLADDGAAILFYSTDYDELIGMCDRIAILAQGRVVRELRGAEINENNIVTAALNLRPVAAAAQ